MNTFQTFRQFAGNASVRFTNHAIERMKEAQIGISEGKGLLYESIRSPEKIDLKRKKYLDNQKNVTYWINGTLIFTVMKKKDKWNPQGEEIFLVITATERRLTVKRVTL